MRLPNGRWEVLPVTRVENRIDVRFARTDEPGVYQLRYRGGGRESRLHFVVMTPRAESNLAVVSESQSRTLAGRVGYERVDPAVTAVASVVARDRAGRELWAMVLACAIGLGVLEMIVARWWSA